MCLNRYNNIRYSFLSNPVASSDAITHLLFDSIQENIYKNRILANMLSQPCVQQYEWLKIFQCRDIRGYFFKTAAFCQNNAQQFPLWFDEVNEIGGIRNKWVDKDSKRSALRRLFYLHLIYKRNPLTFADRRSAKDPY